MQRSSNNGLINKQKSLNVIGLMTGTSMDGIDAALVNIKPETNNASKYDINTISTLLVPFSQEIKDKLNSFIENKIVSIEQLCQMNFIFAELLADAVIQLIKHSDIDVSKIDLISSHGQTIYHSPQDNKQFGYSTKSTLQIGEPSIIAERTGITTIADFRPRDIAAGGEGAPLVCFADQLLFYSSDETRLVQNIGGIANVTVLPENNDPYAFDTGPGNILINLAMQKYFDKEYDESGYIAQKGVVDESWVDKVIKDEPYFAVQPPKTTGREYFNIHYLEKLLQCNNFERNEDIISNLTALTAKSIAEAYNTYVFKKHSPSMVIIGGGGAYNTTLINHLRRYCDKKLDIKSHEDFGISNKFKEAIAFALLGYTTLYNIPNNLPSCTGAEKNVVMGKIIPGNNIKNVL